MAEQYGPGITFLGWVFLFYGIVNFFIIIWHQHKYKEVIATISSCRKYKLQINATRSVCFAILFDFIAEQKTYKVRQDVSIEEWAFSEKKNRYVIGQEMKIYFKRKNPNEINLDVRNFYKRSRMLCPFFICMSLVSLLIGNYLMY